MWGPVSEDELHLYVDGWLDSRRRPAVEAYLEADPGERRRVADYRRQNELLRALGDDIAAAPPPEDDRRRRLAVRRLTARP
jgi:anti-sigma factor RsiW